MKTRLVVLESEEFSLSSETNSKYGNILKTGVAAYLVLLRLNLKFNSNNIFLYIVILYIRYYTCWMCHYTDLIFGEYIVLYTYMLNHFVFHYIAMLLMSWLGLFGLM